MTDQQARKRDIRSFMRTHYTDERLAQLLAHAQDGKLAYVSCCCFIGIATADHSLRSSYPYGKEGRDHLDISRNTLEGAGHAELAYSWLWHLNSEELTPEADTPVGRDAIRIRILIPMIRAEMRRRSAQTAVPAEVQRVAELMEVTK